MRMTQALRSRKRIKGRTIVITGASSGIGRAAALQLAAQGAHVVALARRAPELKRLLREIKAAGGSGSYYAVDLSDFDALDQTAATILARHGKVDVLVNNAARSIRRSITDSLERFHDYERCMQINYFAAVRLTLKLLPAMLKARSGHVINVLTWGTFLPSPRFSAYIASKCALEGFTKSLGAELRGRGIVATTIHYPLVHTPMIAPAAEHYRGVPGMTAENAGAWIVKAVRDRPARVAPGYAVLSGAHAFAFPQLAQVIAGRMSP